MLKFLSLSAILIIFSTSIFAQNSYWTSSGSYIFGFSNASIEDPNNSSSTIQTADAVRFTLWPNIQFHYNYDFGKKVGLLTGVELNNIGFITKEMSSVKDSTSADFNKDVKWKRRSYALSVPLALKFGNIDEGFHFFAGGQVDWLFHYKEKEFLSTGKRKQTEWFSKRVNPLMPSVFVGFGFKGGINIKFTYGLIDFLNTDYNYQNASGNIVKPYEKMRSRLYQIIIFINNPFNDLADSQTKTKQIAIL